MGTAVPGTLRTQPFMPQFRYSELYYGKRYVGVVKKYCGTATFFLQPLMPQFRYSELYYGKRYKSTQLSQFAHAGNRRWSYKFLLLMGN